MQNGLLSSQSLSVGWPSASCKDNIDLEIVTELDLEAGLKDHAVTTQHFWSLVRNNDTEASIDLDGKCTVSGKACSRPKGVRILLENELEGGGCGRKKLVEEQEEYLRNPYGTAYKLVILGSCFMTLGRTLSGSFKRRLMELYPQVGQLRDGLTQMEKALGPDGFRNGEVYDFGSLALDELVSKPADLLYPKSCLLNVASPHDFATSRQTAASGLSKRCMTDLERRECALGPGEYAFEDLCCL